MNPHREQKEKFNTPALLYTIYLYGGVEHRSTTNSPHGERRIERPPRGFIYPEKRE